MSTDARRAILSRRARFIAAALATAGLAATAEKADADANDAGVDAAQPPSPTDIATARALAEEAMKLRAQGKHAEAAQRFVQAYRIDPRPKLLLFIAEETEATGDYVGAIEWYRKVQALGDGGVDVAKRIADVDAKLGSVAIATNEEGVVVLLDEREVGRTPLGPLRVNPGVHRVRLRFDGDRRPVERDVTVASGATVQLTISSDEAAPYPCLSPPLPYPTACLEPPRVCLSPPPPRSGCGCDVVGGSKRG